VRTSLHSLFLCLSIQERHPQLLIPQLEVCHSLVPDGTQGLLLSAVEMTEDISTVQAVQPFGLELFQWFLLRVQNSAVRRVLVWGAGCQTLW
jgi:hypothetical protein